MGRESSAAFQRSSLPALLNDLLKSEPVSSYRQRCHLTRKPSAQLYSERDRRGLGSTTPHLRGKKGKRKSEAQEVHLPSTGWVHAEPGLETAGRPFGPPHMTSNSNHCGTGVGQAFTGPTLRHRESHG